MSERHILAIDQGTTGSTALVMDRGGKTLGRCTKEFRQHFPAPGQVEHEPEEIWQSVLGAVAGALQTAQVEADSLGAIGITNQRETSLVWERSSCRPIHRAIVWQDRRTHDFCAELRRAGHETLVRRRAGLVIDPYFSGTKLRWMLSEVSGARQAALRGELAFGTIDSYLVMRLSGGADAPHVIEVTNASRTLLMDLRRRAWDDDLCKLLEIPASVLPRIVPSAGVIAHTRGVPGLPDGIPIAGIAGDQHAALFGQACFGVGDAKCTYGTGAFVLVNTGAEVRESAAGLLSTMAWQVGDEVVYALEGSAFIAGAAVQWLRDGLGLIKSASDIEPLARSVESSENLFFVPALSGLGAPHWDATATGLITGITRGTTAAHLARATLEGIAFEVDELLQAMAQDLGGPIGRIRVDGGAAANDLLMQTQCDISGVVVERPQELESTARGAAMLAGLGAGLFADAGEARKMVGLERTFAVNLSDTERQSRRRLWQDAVRRARSADA